MFKLIMQHLGLAKPSTATYEVDTVTGTYLATVKFTGLFDPTATENYVRKTVDGIISLSLVKATH